MRIIRDWYCPGKYFLKKESNFFLDYNDSQWNFSLAAIWINIVIFTFEQLTLFAYMRFLLLDMFSINLITMDFPICGKFFEMFPLTYINPEADKKKEDFVESFS